ncbi:MAG: hypothetical protein AAGJ74_06710, partial [Pseudomonadota bacterium]
MPDFALDLATDGIRLLAREGGGWVPMGRVALDDPDMGDHMRALRDAAAHRAGETFETAVIIPGSEILYTTLDAPEDAEDITDETVADLLDGLTPCPVEEMMFDWRREGDVIRVAAVDSNTLAEAEAFAIQFALNPVGFTSRPDEDEFPAAPDFGPSAALRDRDTPTPQQEVAPRPESAPTPRAARSATPETWREWRGPALTAAAVLAFAAVLIWAAFALVAPDDPVPSGEVAPPPVAEGPAEAPEEEAALQPVEPAAQPLPPAPQTPRAAPGPQVVAAPLPTESAIPAGAPAPRSAPRQAIVSEVDPVEVALRREAAG